MMETPTASISNHAKPFGLPWLVFVFLAVLVLCGATFFFQRVWQQHQRGQHYQAVFLSNDQVYYGHLRNWHGNQVLLTDVYYAQAASETDTKDTKQPQFVLVKLTDHATAPKDALYLNRDHILYVEDLAANSQIVQIIEAGKKQ